MAVAFVFAGQGSQYSGMGKDFYVNSESARNIFDTVDKIRPGTSEMCFNGTHEELSLTVNTQPTLFTVDYVCAKALNAVGIFADKTAGFSLGELAALAYADVFSLEDSFKIICKRAEFMDECAKINKGGMAAVLKLSREEIDGIAGKYENVYPVNYNCPGQTAVAGLTEELDLFINEVNNSGGKCIKLAVSGAFHSPLMTEAALKLSVELGNYQINISKLPVYSNYTSAIYGDNISELLSKQLMSPVQWENTINNMIADGIDVFIEVGAGKTLSGLIKRISKDVLVLNADKFDDIEKVKNELENYLSNVKK